MEVKAWNTIKHRWNGPEISECKPAWAQPIDAREPNRPLTYDRLILAPSRLRVKTSTHGKDAFLDEYESAGCTGPSDIRIGG
jgi:hypothetical protein